eukprot:CAMPEP_0197461942 /NCGR_PEP_ID=MMETSP1175-20131217/57787_1 /TAXON_ID=1003142 /ORGANISM="Triceratium dubium, Strain CCMP147" /LENGTH=135 /DNA_ID=CAMNT_0042997329 /DNA_START=377 /DNA_END=780 /DNA_ORIENTATION=+
MTSVASSLQALCLSNGVEHRRPATKKPQVKHVPSRKSKVCPKRTLPQSILLPMCLHTEGTPKRRRVQPARNLIPRLTMRPEPVRLGLRCASFQVPTSPLGGTDSGNTESSPYIIQRQAPMSPSCWAMNAVSPEVP